MSKKLEILKRSLEKKQKEFDSKLQAHFESVKAANGQPLNDKRGGHATMNRWEKQEYSLSTLKKSIDKTKEAIDVEYWKIKGVEHVKRMLPDEIVKRIESGKLIQWRKHPHIFFVPGVEKARIHWDIKKEVLSHMYVGAIPGGDQREIFADAFNSLKAQLAESVDNSC